MNKYNFLIHNLLLIAILLGWASSSRADVDIIGKWNGKWVSDARGQSGPLVATFSKNEKKLACVRLQSQLFFYAVCF